MDHPGPVHDSFYFISILQILSRHTVSCHSFYQAVLLMQSVWNNEWRLYTILSCQDPQNYTRLTFILVKSKDALSSKNRFIVQLKSYLSTLINLKTPVILWLSSLKHQNLNDAYLRFRRGIAASFCPARQQLYKCSFSWSRKFHIVQHLICRLLIQAPYTCRTLTMNIIYSSGKMLSEKLALKLKNDIFLCK